MKKILLLVFCFAFFSGCTVNYDIDIDNTVSENIQFDEDYSHINDNIYTSVISRQKTYKDGIYELNKYPISVLSNQVTDIYDSENKIDGTIYYDSSIIDDGMKYGIQFNASYKLNDIEYVKIFNTCYDYVDIKKSNNILSINVSGENLCFKYYNLMDELNIRLRTKYKVISNNSTSKDGKYYIWNINKDNYKDQKISFEIDTAKKVDTGFSLFQILLIIFGLLLIIGGIIVVFMRGISKKNNKM